jgi:hypothetical protein
MATPTGQLTLGWHVTLTREPRFWQQDGARPGKQTKEDLLEVSAGLLASHTAIIAQSGSGKSFFLGRLIEEIALNTRARCVIFDPNADFRRIREVESAALWKNAVYNRQERQGKLPHEPTRAQFENRWKNVGVRVRVGTSQINPAASYEQLRLWWPSLSMAFLADDIDPMLRSDLYHCHAFVQELARLAELRYWSTGKAVDLIDEAKRVFRLTRGLLGEDLRSDLEDYAIDKLSKPSGFGEDLVFIGKILASKSSLSDRYNRFIERAMSLAEYVSPAVERFYFGRAQEYRSAGILQTSPRESPWAAESTNRIEVIDLPSIKDPGTRLLAISAVLATEWDRAREAWAEALTAPTDNRVPTFIVVDEAHNVIPEDPRGKPDASLREQFRTIAAEGRKYGLFLLLVSQRPDKLDKMVLSECENKAVMKLGSGAVLNVTREMLGLDDLPPKLLEKCLEFETGRVLMMGQWMPQGPQIIYAAARRTIEGGRNLRQQHWAVSDDSAEIESHPPTLKIRRKRGSKSLPKKAPNAKK